MRTANDGRRCQPAAFLNIIVEISVSRTAAELKIRKNLSKTNSSESNECKHATTKNLIDSNHTADVVRSVGFG